MKRAIIYARVSTKRQADDGLPVESQIDHCRSKADALGESDVAVDYLPECLVRLDGRTRVHSANNWLPVPSTLRTVRLVIHRPVDKLRRVA